MSGGVEKNARARRDYRPNVERLEPLRPLSVATHAHPLSEAAVERDLLPGQAPEAGPLAREAASHATSAPIPSDAWDAALDHHARRFELLDVSDAGDRDGNGGRAGGSFSRGPGGLSSAPGTDDAAAQASGLNQLNRYLNRAWFRAGIPAQLHDDSSQAVYTSLLQSLGRQRFDTVLGEVGDWGVPRVLGRDSAEGMTFLRAVDMVKKRARREKAHQSLDAMDVPEARNAGQSNGRMLRGALQDAIQQTLSPREAALIHDTLMGKTPAEIASRWGVASKTVSNEKSRALQKLREALADYQMN